MQTFSQPFLIIKAGILFYLFFLNVACHQVPQKGNEIEPEPTTILSPPNEAASSPQSIKVTGIFDFTKKDSGSLADMPIEKFIVQQVLSLSSSLSHIVGEGDTLQIRLSGATWQRILANGTEAHERFQLILQEKLQMGREEIIYSLKDLQSIR